MMKKFSDILQNKNTETDISEPVISKDRYVFVLPYIADQDAIIMRLGYNEIYEQESFTCLYGKTSLTDSVKAVSKLLEKSGLKLKTSKISDILEGFIYPYSTDMYYSSVPILSTKDIDYTEMNDIVKINVKNLRGLIPSDSITRNLLLELRLKLKTY